MTLRIVLIVYVIIHIIACLLIYLGIRSRVLKFSTQLFPIIVLVPVAGMLVGIVAEVLSRFRKAGTKPISLEELHLGLEDLRLSHVGDDDDEEETIIPLEEAMSINDAETRRKLMLEILHRNPNEYLGLLQEARLDDDIEVSHYASTAMMEVEREYELSLQKAEKEYNDDPDSPDKLDIYLRTLKQYISSGLIDENVLFVYTHRYSELLDDKIKKNPDDMSCYAEAVDNCLSLSSFTRAEEYANRMVEKWPSEEDAWFAKLKIYRSMNNGEGIKKIIAEILRRKIYLTPEGKETIRFWDPNAGRELAEVDEVV